MTTRAAIQEVLEKLRTDPSFSDNVVHYKSIEGKDAVYAEFPHQLHPSIIKALASKGIHQFYSHQREAFELASVGKSFTAVTPTASGKSLCYHLPVIKVFWKMNHHGPFIYFQRKHLPKIKKRSS